MNITVSELLINPNYYSDLNFIGKQIYDFKLQFVIERLIPLDEKLSKEESVNDNAEIRLFMDGTTVNDLIQIRGYNNDLIDNIKACFGPENIAYFESRIYQIAGEHRQN